MSHLPFTTTDALQERVEQFVQSTRSRVYIRQEDGLLILRPNRLHYLNATATFVMSRLYSNAESPDVEQVVKEVVEEFGVEPSQVRLDIERLLDSLSALLHDDTLAAPAARIMPFGSHKRELPVLSEVALTYRCQNRCTFCYADSPQRGGQVREMTTAEVQVILDRIMDEAHCPSVSFTGGEPTLREDLPALVAYAHEKGLLTNLITNGYRCADAAYVQALADAGLDSAQVSLEGGSAQVHDAITQHPGSWARTVRAVHNLRAVGIHTHTNTTICGGNREHLMELVDFIADELHSEYFSMNMVIRTGAALEHREDDVRYSEIGDLIRSVQSRAREKGIGFVWYSPVPYCLFNTVQAGLGSQSCACMDGLLSVNPEGQLVPCSSFERGVGDLLHQPFDKVWHSRTALYWRRKEFLPPPCQRCEIRDICCGACPLYWDQRGNLAELEGLTPRARPLANIVWRTKKTLWSGTRGVGLGRKGGGE